MVYYGGGMMYKGEMRFASGMSPKIKIDKEIGNFF